MNRVKPFFFLFIYSLKAYSAIQLRITFTETELKVVPWHRTSVKPYLEHCAFLFTQTKCLFLYFSLSLFIQSVPFSSSPHPHFHSG